MSPTFATIRFGPFSTAFHRRAVDDGFREALDAYLRTELLPQVDEPFESTSGSLTPEVNDEKHCGPNSLVKDVYKLEFEFIRDGSSDQITAEVRRNPRTGNFEPRYKHQRLFLWTRKRLEENRAFEKIAKALEGGQPFGDTCLCPRCGSMLKLFDAPTIFDLACPRGCFAYSFHRDPATKAFRHGHFFSGPPMR